MKQFPKLRPCGWDALVALAVVLLALLCAGRVWTGAETQAVSVVISVDGQEVERCALERFTAQSYSYHGYTLCVERTGSGVRVAESDCPTQDCVHTGSITRQGQSIVCLPARVVIELTGSGADALDLVIG